MSQETGLAKPGAGTSIVKVGEYSLTQILEKQLYKSEEIAKVAIVLFPVTALDQLPAMHKPSLSVIKVDTDQKSKDTYYITGEQRGLSKAVILKMLKAAGAHVVTQKMTPDHDIDVIRWSAVVYGRLPDGTMHSEPGSKPWSWIKCQEDFIRKALEKNKTAKAEYRVSEEDAKAKGLKAALQYREFADEQTETKAVLRAARAFLNIQTSYSPAELAKPFLIARSVPDLDMSDPEIKRMTAQRLIDSTFALYGAPGEAPMLPPVIFPDPPAETSDDEFDDDVPWGDEDQGGTAAAESKVTDAEFTRTPPAPAQPANAERTRFMQRLAILCNEVFKTDAEMRLWLAKEYEISSRKELTDEQIIETVDKLVIIKQERTPATGVDEIDTQLLSIQSELGDAMFEAILQKLGKTTLAGCKQAVKQAALNFAIGVRDGKVQL